MTKVKSAAKTEPGPTAGAEPAAFFLRTMQRLHQGLLRQVAPVLEQEHGLDFRLYSILRLIDTGVVHPGAISKMTYLPNSVVTRHIDQLAEKGLLERSLDPDDSRRIKLTLTPDGHRLAREANRTICAIVGRPLEHMAASERDAFLNTLVKLADDLAP